MSRADLPKEIEVDFSHMDRCWVVRIPLHYVEGEMHRQGRWMAGPPATTDDMRRAGRTMAHEIAAVLAMPGPIQREAREQVQQNNRRRFGP